MTRSDNSAAKRRLGTEGADRHIDEEQLSQTIELKQKSTKRIKSVSTYQIDKNILKCSFFLATEREK